MVSAASTGELERFADICHEYELPYSLGELEENVTVTRLAEESSGSSAPAMVLVKAPLSEGVVFPEAQLAIYGNADLFETLAAAAPALAAEDGEFLQRFLGPEAGRLRGARGSRHRPVRRPAAGGVEGATGEFMLLRYADDATLYVPLARLDLVQKYQSLGGVEPTLDRLGTTVWEARKTRVRKSVDDMAEQLLALYAERKTAPGHAFPPDANWQREFEDAFEFEETPDQQRAIADVKRDMESHAADGPAALRRRRLRQDGSGHARRVQGAGGFQAGGRARADHGARVPALRNVSPALRRVSRAHRHAQPLSHATRNRRKLCEELEAGKVDIVIGTHRLLSKDVKFHDLGLLVVDEEQRFGVAHKERLKEMRKNVDVLTMSATPIPRTLHMSLVGLARHERDRDAAEGSPGDSDRRSRPSAKRWCSARSRKKWRARARCFSCTTAWNRLPRSPTMVKRLVPQGARGGRPRPDARERSSKR